MAKTRRLENNFILLHIRENIAVYSAVTILFILGVTGGALAVRRLDSGQINELNSILGNFRDYLSVDKPLNQAAILKRSLLQNGLFILLLWLCGSFAPGFIPAAALVFYRGFTIGFTVGFLARRSALGGIIFALAAVLPQNLLFVPATIAAGVFSFSASLLLLDRRLQHRRLPYRSFFPEYTLAIFLAALFLVAGSLAEALITPVFMRAAVPFIQ
jgi:stage II sporulation protein M